MVRSTPLANPVVCLARSDLEQLSWSRNRDDSCAARIRAIRMTGMSLPINWKPSTDNGRQLWGKLANDHPDAIAEKRDWFTGKVQVSCGITPVQPVVQRKRFEERKEDQNALGSIGRLRGRPEGGHGRQGQPRLMAPNRKTTILFLCTGNACRSQMADACAAGQRGFRGGSVLQG